jgi:hypothetical protein
LPRQLRGRSQRCAGNATCNYPISTFLWVSGLTAMLMYALVISLQHAHSTAVARCRILLLYGLSAFVLWDDAGSVDNVNRCSPFAGPSIQRKIELVSGITSNNAVCYCAELSRSGARWPSSAPGSLPPGSSRATSGCSRPHRASATARCTTLRTGEKAESLLCVCIACVSLALLSCEPFCWSACADADVS